MVDGAAGAQMARGVAGGFAEPEVEKFLDAIAQSHPVHEASTVQWALAWDGTTVMGGCLGRDTTDLGILVFSASKPLVAVAVLSLIEEGRFTLNDPVATVLPGFGGNGKEAVLVRHLLSHGEGLPSASVPGGVLPDPEQRPQMYKEWKAEWPPGTRFSYAGPAYYVLADLIETATGEDFREVIAQCTPIPGFVLGGQRAADMSTVETVCIDSEGSMTEGFPGLPPLEILDSAAFRDAGIPAGGGVATADAMALFYQQLLVDRARRSVIAIATGKIENRHVDERLGVVANYGLGFAIAGQGDTYLRSVFGSSMADDCFGHNGTGGQVCWADPTSGVSFAYLTNELDRDIARATARFQKASTAAAELAASAVN